MNRMTFARLAIAAFRTTEIPDAISLLDQVLEKLSENGNKEVEVMVKMEVAHYKLRTGDMNGPKKTIEECRESIENLSFVDPSINAVFYRVSADYDKVTN